MNKYKVYATTVNVYEVEVEAQTEDDARDVAIDVWEAKGLEGFKRVNQDCDFEVNEAYDEEGSPQAERMVQQGFNRSRY